MTPLERRQLPERRGALSAAYMAQRREQETPAMNPGPCHAPCSRNCVNPAHLEPVSRGVNVLRGRGVTAEAARREQCPAGHPYVRRTAGRRYCPTCKANWTREYLAKPENRARATARSTEWRIKNREHHNELQRALARRLNAREAAEQAPVGA